MLTIKTSMFHEKKYLLLISILLGILIPNKIFCEANYVEQAKRKIKRAVAEHVFLIRKPSNPNWKHINQIQSDFDTIKKAWQPYKKKDVITMLPIEQLEFDLKKISNSIKKNKKLKKILMM